MLPTFFSRMVMFRILCCVICYYSVLVDGAVIQMNDGNVEENLIGKKATFMMVSGIGGGGNILPTSRSSVH